MKFRRPFRIDPSSTESFSVLDEVSSAGSITQESYAQDALKAVVIGGGTGAPVSIRTLLSLGVETSAVVAMADDGGSTGALREEADVTAPGDIRKCIVAFARNPQDPLVKSLKYRFAIASDHTLGNLLLAALEDATGSFPEAIAVCERLVDARGHVYPSTLDHITLSAKTRDGRLLEGQAAACKSKTALERVELHGQGGAISPYKPALEAIRNADLIVLGPGSLFTSIIPNLLVPGVVDAIRESHGRVLFVCSLADVQGETWGLTAREHVEALIGHGMDGLIDYVLVHSDKPLRSTASSPDRLLKDSVVLPAANSNGSPTAISDAARVRAVDLSYEDMLALQAMGPVVILRDLADRDHPTWHAPLALREAFGGVIRLCRSRRR
ncbi:MAG: YvcK family protein [Eggerthellaceae bacterium]|nr:YvcK family protein [Eggerthellaceae bacterium]